MRALAALNTFKVVSLPLVAWKYVFNIYTYFNIIYKPNGDVDKYKVKLVAQGLPRATPRGFSQQEGVDNNEIDATVVDNTFISILLSTTNQTNREL